ncbi:MAG: HAMP domain-containing histidine kinase [Spirochaetaceae bacterium]
MRLNLQRYIIYVALLTVTILFIALYIYVNRDIEENKIKSGRLLINTVLYEIKDIQGEIMNSFEEFLDSSRDYTETNSDIEFETLYKQYNSMINNSVLKQIVNSISYVEIGEEIKYRSIFQGDLKFNFPQDMELSLRNLRRHREQLFIENYIGTFIFPLTPTENNEYKAILITMSYEQLIKDNLLTQVNKNILPDFIVELKRGRNIKSDDLIKYDQVFNLNKIFNLEKRDDYYRRVQGIFKEDSLTITEQDLYLLCSHRSGSIEKYYNNKKVLYIIGIGILYVTIIFSLLYIYLYGINLKRNIDREKEFTALISHELKTPLSVIKLGSDNIKSGVINDPDGIKYYGKLISDESVKLSKMIDNILNISTNNWNNKDVIMTYINIEDVLNKTIVNLRPVIESSKTNIIINNYLKDDSLYCHSESIMSCLQNIIDNGIKYGVKRSENKDLFITVKDTKKGKQKGISFIIQDFGPGIKSNEWGDIFKNYRRGKSVIKEQIPGSGLGLAITKRVIEKFNGSIHFHKTLKKGATFELWIPERK